MVTVTTPNLFNGDTIVYNTHDDTPNCEICEKFSRGGNNEKGVRKAKLSHSITTVIKKLEKHNYKSFVRIKITGSDIIKYPNKTKYNRPNNEIFVCACCYESYRLNQRYTKYENSRTKPLI